MFGSINFQFDFYELMHQLKPFKQYTFYKNKQLDGMNNIYGDNNVFSILLTSLRSNKTNI